MDQAAGDQPTSSLEYWQRDEVRQVQMSYVALCLLMAAVQDAILGEAERRFKNLNWSATISYYSLVHSGRLLVFSGLGDYPMQHAGLRNLLAGESVRLDWLSAHRRITQQHPRERPRATIEALHEGLDRIGLVASEHWVQAFSKRLSAAAALRNDSNYEALLVAHEHDHGVVTEAFERLSIAMGGAARSCLWTAVEAHRCLRLHHPNEAIEGLAFEFFHSRVVPAMMNKCVGNRAAMDLLDEVEHQLQLNDSAEQSSPSFSVLSFLHYR